MTASDLIDVRSTTTAFQVSCGHLANATSLPNTYRLLSVFSGIPLYPLVALHKAGLTTVNEEGKLEYPVYGHSVLRQLRDRGHIRWVSWQQPAGKDAQPVPAGYVLTGTGEAQLSQYYDLYGPALIRRFQS